MFIQRNDTIKVNNNEREKSNLFLNDKCNNNVIWCMPIKNCIHYQEDKLTSLQFHLHSRNSIVQFAALERNLIRDV